MGNKTVALAGPEYSAEGKDGDSGPAVAASKATNDHDHDHAAQGSLSEPDQTSRHQKAINMAFISYREACLSLNNTTAIAHLQFY